MSEANITYFSRGIVAMNKLRGTDIISAWPVDIISEVDDEVTTGTQDVTVNGIDNDDNPISIKMVRGVVIKNIKWGGAGDSNRVTPPDVRRGERVDIYQVADDDNYYWKSSGLDLSKRRLETILHIFSANPLNDAINDDTNTWSSEVNTHDGHITIRTTQANGEKAAFTVQLDCAEGIGVLEDQKGNYFYFNSVENDIKVRNADNSFIQIVKKVINLETETYNIKCKTMNVDSGQTTWKNGKAWDLGTDTYVMNAGSSADIVAGSTVTINGATVNIN